MSSSRAALGAATLAVGGLAGAAGSLCGMGGAFISMPLLTEGLKLPIHRATGTSMAAVAATGLAGALSWGSAGLVPLPHTRRI